MDASGQSRSDAARPPTSKRQGDGQARVHRGRGVALTLAQDACPGPRAAHTCVLANHTMQHPPHTPTSECPRALDEIFTSFIVIMIMMDKRSCYASTRTCLDPNHSNHAIPCHTLLCHRMPCHTMPYHAMHSTHALGRPNHIMHYGAPKTWLDSCSNLQLVPVPEFVQRVVDRVGCLSGGLLGLPLVRRRHHRLPTTHGCGSLVVPE